MKGCRDVGNNEIGKIMDELKGKRSWVVIEETNNAGCVDLVAQHV